MKRDRRLCGAFLGVLVVVTTFAGCSTGEAAPRGYERIGAAEGATLFAKKEADSRVSVVLRSRGGNALCSASGSVGKDTRGPLPALCDGSSGDTYAFVLPALRDGQVAPIALCDKQSGAAEQAAHVGAPESWAVDFMVAVRPLASTRGIMPCAQ